MGLVWTDYSRWLWEIRRSKPIDWTFLQWWCPTWPLFSTSSMPFSLRSDGRIPNRVKCKPNHKPGMRSKQKTPNNQLTCRWTKHWMTFSVCFHLIFILAKVTFFWAKVPEHQMNEWIENNQVLNECDLFTGLVSEVALHIITPQFSPRGLSEEM